MQTGENEQGLRKVLDMTRLMSIIILLLHFYFHCYAAFKEWQLTSTISDRLLHNIYTTGLFSTLNKSKVIALILLIISLLGSRGKKNEKLKYKPIIIYVTSGLVLYFGSFILLSIRETPVTVTTYYISITTTGFILFLTGGTQLSRILRLKLSNDIFNKKMKPFHRKRGFLKMNIQLIYLPAII